VTGRWVDLATTAPRGIASSAFTVAEDARTPLPTTSYSPDLADYSGGMNGRRRRTGEVPVELNLFYRTWPADG
jgi:hypothetical protein